MSKRTIEPIRVVLPDAGGGYYRFGDLPELIAEALLPDTEEADADPQGSYYVIRALDQMKYKKDLPRAATLAPGEPGYLHVVENSVSKRPLEWRMGAVLDAGLVHLDWLNEWGESRNPPFVFSTETATKPQDEAEKVAYVYPMFERLKPRTPWTGGRMVDTDVLTLADAASMATKHAGEAVSIGDFLRAAARGEITLRAIIHRTAKVQKHDGGIYCNGGEENENKVPAGAIATLPLTACQHLAAAGRASWRTFDGFEERDGILMRYTKGMLTDDEPDLETVPEDCRLVGYDVHALADEYTAPDAKQAEPQAAPVVAENTSHEAEAQEMPMKKAALIAALEHEWGSIEADLSEATRNGLKVAAHAGTHGEWFASKARAWAVSKGKIRQAAPVIHTAIWPGTVTRKRI